jgi:hypothetical protein
LLQELGPHRVGIEKGFIIGDCALDALLCEIGPLPLLALQGRLFPSDCPRIWCRRKLFRVIDGGRS